MPKAQRARRKETDRSPSSDPSSPILGRLREKERQRERKQEGDGGRGSKTLEGDRKRRRRTEDATRINRGILNEAGGRKMDILRGVVPKRENKRERDSAGGRSEKERVEKK